MLQYRGKRLQDALKIESPRKGAVSEAEVTNTDIVPNATDKSQGLML